jgi:hypothetical protein
MPQEKAECFSAVLFCLYHLLFNQSEGIRGKGGAQRGRTVRPTRSALGILPRLRPATDAKWKVWLPMAAVGPDLRCAAPQYQVRLLGSC